MAQHCIDPRVLRMHSNGQPINSKCSGGTSVSHAGSTRRLLVERFLKENKELLIYSLGNNSIICVINTIIFVVLFYSIAFLSHLIKH